jgi:hypothetical protein
MRHAPAPAPAAAVQQEGMAGGGADGSLEAPLMTATEAAIE